MNVTSLLLKLLPALEAQLKPLLVQFIVDNAPRLIDEVFKAAASAATAEAKKS